MRSYYANLEVDTSITFRPATDSQGTVPLKCYRMTVYGSGPGANTPWSSPIPPGEPSFVDVLPPTEWYKERVERTTEFSSDFNFKEDKGDMLWKYAWDINYPIPTSFLQALSGIDNVRIDVQVEIDLGPTQGQSTPDLTIDVGSLLVNSVMSLSRTGRPPAQMSGNRATFIQMQLLGRVLESIASGFLVIRVEYESAVRWPSLPTAMLAALFRVRFNVQGWLQGFFWRPSEEEGWEVMDVLPDKK